MAVHRLTWHDAYDAQMGTWAFQRSRPGLRWLAENYGQSTRGLSDSFVTLMRGLYSSENDRLRSADPIFVSSEMCQLIDHAKDDFEPEPLWPSDLITACGFVYYETPFQVPDRFDHPTNIQAVSWAPLLGRSPGDMFEQAGIPAGHAQIDLAAGASKDDFLGLLRQRAEGQGEDELSTDGIVITLYREPPADGGWQTPLLLLHVSPWWFGMTFVGNETDATGKPTGAAWWWKIIQVTLRLMQQKVAVRRTERPPRAQRRSAGRIGWKPDQDVLVVRLRREYDRSEHEPTGDGAHYSHRFIVHGFWRNQYYAASDMHRQIWIDDFVKGPKDKPLIIRPRRAFTWDR